VVIPIRLARLPPRQAPSNGDPYCMFKRHWVAFHGISVARARSRARRYAKHNRGRKIIGDGFLFSEKKRGEMRK
jgi:hypothetical protein